MRAQARVGASVPVGRPWRTCAWRETANVTLVMCATVRGSGHPGDKVNTAAETYIIQFFLVI